MGKIKDTPGRSSVEEREIAQDAVDRVGLERSSKWGGFAHQSTIYFDPKSPPEPEERNRLFGIHSLPTEAFEVRTEVQQAEQLLRDGGLPTEPTAERTLTELINELGYGPTDEEPTTAEIASFGRGILAEEELWPLIQKAISYGQAIYRRDHFALVTRKLRQRGKQKRSDPLLSALTEWPRMHPDKSAQEIMSDLLSHRPTSPNAGKYLLWLDVVTIYVYDTESHETFSYRKRSLERRIRLIRDQRKK